MDWFSSIKEYVIPLLDILLVAYIMYVLYNGLLGTRTIHTLRGVFLIVLSYFIGDLLGLETFLWLYTRALEFAAIGVLIIFQNEIRRFVMRIGEKLPLFKSYSKDEGTKDLDIITKAVYDMAKVRIGALIVITKNIKLGAIAERGIEIDGVITSELIESIFDPTAPLHDGAVIVTDGRIIAASCFLRLTDRIDLDNTLGTRHRAALGLSEDSDAVILVVSEENASVSLVYDKEIYNNLEKKDCNELLKLFLYDEDEEKINIVKRAFNKVFSGSEAEGKK